MTRSSPPSGEAPPSESAPHTGSTSPPSPRTAGTASADPQARQASAFERIGSAAAPTGPVERGMSYSTAWHRDVVDVAVAAGTGCAATRPSGRSRCYD